MIWTCCRVLSFISTESGASCFLQISLYKKFKHDVIKSELVPVFSPQWYHWGGSTCLRSDKPLTPTQDPWEPSQELELTPETKEAAGVKVCSVQTGWSVQLDLPQLCHLFMYSINTVTIDFLCHHRRGSLMQRVLVGHIHLSIMKANERGGWREWKIFRLLTQILIMAQRSHWFYFKWILNDY